ncbi:MAG: J domain-containing protein [Treponema sp.]|jgi:DnaJ like chaperone protein|nr:J domain-containing protein [Treponema sp.]
MKLRFGKLTPAWIIAGAAAGYLLGTAGAVIGALLGYFLSELFSQLGSDRAALKYFENPGPSSFYEGEPGLAAFCALGVFLMSKASPRVLIDEAASARIAGGAVSVFPRGKAVGLLAESFCRLAFTKTAVLNPDILCESLAARRRGAGDLPLLAAELASMAAGRAAQREASYIRQFLDPTYQPPLPDAVDDPWKVLGIPEGSSREEAKSAFRGLARMFHPDNQTGLSAEEAEKMSDSFIKVRDAYRELMRLLPRAPREL